MIDDLRAMVMFVRVAELGSFRGAAKSLNVSPSVVSQQIASLEARLDVALLYRSTRNVSLTTEGQRLIGPAQRMLSAAESGLAQFVSSSKAPVGHIKIALPATLSSHELVDDIAAFARTNTGIAFSLYFADTRLNMMREGIDLAFRMGSMEKTSLRTKMLFEEPRKLVASKSFVKSNAAVTKPAQLGAWEEIGFMPRLDRVTLIHVNGRSVRIGGEPRLSVDSAQAMHRLVLAGAGYAVLPAAMVDQHISEGKLVHVLPKWSPRPLPVHAVWPDSSPRNTLTSLLIDHLSKKAKNRP